MGRAGIIEIWQAILSGKLAGPLFQKGISWGLIKNSVGIYFSGIGRELSRESSDLSKRQFCRIFTGKGSKPPRYSRRRDGWGRFRGC